MATEFGMGRVYRDDIVFCPSGELQRHLNHHPIIDENGNTRNENDYVEIEHGVYAHILSIPHVFNYGSKYYERDFGVKTSTDRDSIIPYSVPVDLLSLQLRNPENMPINPTWDGPQQEL